MKSEKTPKISSINIKANIPSSHLAPKNHTPDVSLRLTAEKSVPKQRNTYGGELLLNNLRIDNGLASHLSSSKDRNPPQNVVKNRGSVNVGSNITSLLPSKATPKVDPAKSLTNTLNHSKEQTGSLFNNGALNMAMTGRPKVKLESKRDFAQLNTDSKLQSISIGASLTSSHILQHYETSRFSTHGKNITERDPSSHTPANLHRSEVKRPPIVNNQEKTRTLKPKSEIALDKDILIKEVNIAGKLSRNADVKETARAVRERSKG